MPTNCPRARRVRGTGKSVMAVTLCQSLITNPFPLLFLLGLSFSDWRPCMQLRLHVKRLDIEANSSSVHKNRLWGSCLLLLVHKTINFTFCEHIALVQTCRDAEVDSYFSIFERLAMALKWPAAAWSLLLLYSVNFTKKPKRWCLHFQFAVWHCEKCYSACFWTGAGRVQTEI